MKIKELSPQQKQLILEKLGQKENVARAIADSAPGQTTEYRRLESWIDGWLAGALIILGSGTDSILSKNSLADLKSKLLWDNG